MCLDYWLSGNVTSLLVPETTAGGRADGLWRHSCFEAFVRPGDDQAYWELNLSPSGKWALYRFDAYREGMRNADAARDPAIETESGEENLHLRARIAFADTRLARSDWRIAPAAVIEDRSGRLSYWAVMHGSERPDFHHSEGFAIELPVPH